MHHFFLFPDAQKNGGKTVWKCGGIGKKSSFSSTFFNFVFPDEKCPFKNETMHGSDLSALFPQKGTLGLFGLFRFMITVQILIKFYVRLFYFLLYTAWI